MTVILANTQDGDVLGSVLGWCLELGVSIIPQIGAGVLGLAALALVLRKPRFAMAFGLLAATFFWNARDLFIPAVTSVEARDARVVWANVYGREEAFARAMTVAAEEGADVVVIGELPYGLTAAQIAKLAGPYTHHAGRPNVARVNVAAFSRTPFTVAEPMDPEDPALARSLTLLTPTPAGLLRIEGVHATVPMSPGLLAARDATLEALWERDWDALGPSLLVGDFNTTPWSARLRAAERKTPLRRASVGLASTWMQPLWIAPAPIFGLPIDHAFTAGGVRAAARVGPRTGSDHRPLIIDVQLPRER